MVAGRTLSHDRVLNEINRGEMGVIYDEVTQG
jgi:hypothetical protein